MALVVSFGETVLLGALAGFTIYLGLPVGRTIAPGDFYGPAGDRFVRIAFTATDDRVAAAVERLGQDIDA